MTLFPTTEWPTTAPESQGVDSVQLASAFAFLDSACGYNGASETVVIRNGCLIHAGKHSRRAHNIWSCTKSFVNAALGMLIQDGLCELDTPAAQFEPLLRDLYPTVTLRHFATMTSGFQAAGTSRWGQRSRDWTTEPFTPAEPLFAPGSAFCYWDNAMNMFGRVLTRIARRDLKSLLTERLTEPIGLGDWAWWTDSSVDGIPVYYAGTGIEINAHQLARFGYLYLNHGCWDGKPLIDPAWVALSTRPQVPASLPVADTDRKSIDGRGVYGLNWWTNGVRPTGLPDIPNAPAGAYYARGLHNNRCFVIPEWNMIVVRMGRDKSGVKDTYNTFFGLLSQAVT